MENKNQLTEEQILEKAGIRVTAVRLLIFRELRRSFPGAFSLSDREDALPTVEKSTIFRTLSVFSEAHLLHDIDDGSGSHKYCVCSHDDTLHCTGHVHLACRICHRTFCLPDVRIPQVILPEGFVPEETEYLVKGVCPECAKKTAG
jgi:Fur family ferric uptake transcriptional regulator